MSEQYPPANHPDQAASRGKDARRGGGARVAGTRPTARTAQPVASFDTADVIVVGAGPAGSAAAYHMATAGLDVLLLEKTSFPREKVCGDGLTPRAVKALTVDGHPCRSR